MLGIATAFIALAATLNAGQGTAVRLDVPVEAGLVAVEAEWRERSVPLVRDGEWFAVLGVDLDDAPGEHAVPLKLEYDDGTVRDETVTIVVEPGEYPTTRLEVEPKYVELSEANQARAATEREEINAIYATVTMDRLWVEPFEVPIPGVAGGRNFGHRRVFNDQPRAPHSGADLRAATGTEIRAANAGTVALAKNLFFSGNAVFIDHGLGVFTTYLHLSEIDVEVGDSVERGQVLGLAGATGRVTGPHLHWGVRVLDARVDPFSLLTLGAPSVE